MELVYQSFTLPKFDSEFTPEKLPFASKTENWEFQAPFFRGKLAFKLREC